ncbi:MAG: hypothetical protein CSA20_00910 [Deltaproteobacteria bacterium]|nr:MAG: hypothetical protein CSA20_00910 [Deltaproteobacteria bacterium]
MNLKVRVLLISCIVVMFILVTLWVNHYTMRYVRKEIGNRSGQLEFIERRLLQIDREVKQLKKLHVQLPPTTVQGNGTANERKRAVASLSRRTTELEEKYRALEHTVNAIAGNSMTESDTIHALPVQPVPPFESHTNKAWISLLSEEKMAEVQAIFEEQAEFIRSAVPVSPDDRFPDPEEMREILITARHDLAEKLKEVLSEEEYEAFLNATQPPFQN